MQFQVPQFLDVEDKVIGPLTIKQFLYVAGGAGMAYLLWRFVPYVGLMLAIGALVLGGMLAFYKFNGKPLIYIIEAGFDFIQSTRLYIWQRRKQVETELNLSNFKTTKQTSALTSTNTGSKLNQLTWSIDVQQKNETESQRVRTDADTPS